MATYLKFHELEQSPFEGPGSDRLVLATEALRRAFAEIKTGLDEGAPRICLSGGPGIGKSSMARALPKLLAKDARAALVRDPSRDWSRVRASIAKQLNLEAGQLSRASLLAARPPGQRLVLVIDQAEHLPAESLEQLDALLGYRDDDGQQLLHCVLIANLEDAPRGQDVPLLWWLDQLTTRQLIMAPIPEAGLRSYVDKHLAKAGAPDARVFDDDALRAIHRYTGGVPGAVSALCEQLLDKAASAGSRVVTAALVARVFGDPPPAPSRPARPEPAAATPRPTAEPEEEPAIDHSNTPPPAEPEPSLPRFGEGRPVGSTPGPGAGGRGAFAPPADAFEEPEPELQVQQGLLPMEESGRYAEESDFFAPPSGPSRTAARRSEPAPRRDRAMHLGPASPASGRGARMVRNLIALAVLAALAAVAHAWWRESGEATVLALWASSKGEVTRPARSAPAKPQKKAARASLDPEEGVHPLVPPGQRELALRSLELEDTQGRDEEAPHEGLTSDLKLDLGGAPGRQATPPGEDAETLSLRDLYEIAEKAEAEGADSAPWTQQGPGAEPAAPAAPAPTR